MTAFVRRRFAVEWWLIALLLPLFMLWASDRSGLGDINRAAYDQLQRAERQAGPSPDLVIVGIDARSIAALGPWPWSRATHAQLLEQLAAQPPRSVLFNVFFDAPGPPADDARMAAAMAKLPVYLPMNFVDATAAAAAPAGPASHFVAPVRVLAQAAHGLGHANMMTDGDERVRTVFRYEGTAARLVPYLGLLVATGAHDAAPASPAFEPRGRWTRRERFGFRLAGPAGSYRTVSYVDVLQGTVPGETLRGKTLLVGATGDSRLNDQLAVTGLGARHAALPGVEVHANAIDMLTRGETIEFPEAPLLWLWIALPIWAAMGLFRLNVPHAAGGALLLGGVTVALGSAALQDARIALPVATPLAGIGLAYGLWSWRRMAAAARFFRLRIDALNAVPAGAFEPVRPVAPAVLDAVEQDIRTLDRAIDRLMALQSTLSTALALMPVAVLICRSDGTIGQSNAAARMLLAPGRTDERLVGHTLFALLAPMRRTALVEPSMRPAGDIAAPWRETTTGEYTTAQGAIFRTQTVCLGEPGSGSAFEDWVLVVLRDLTLERQSERERAALLSFVSHDLRAPQASILSLLELQAMGHEAITSRDLSAAIAREARRTLAMADSFVTMLEAESTDYRFAAVSLASVTMDALDAVWAAAQHRGVTIVEQLDDEAFVMADGGLLSRALRNLLDNAIRHSPAGAQLKVCLATDLAPVRRGAEVILSVRDEGEGMDGRRLARARGAGGDHRRRGHGTAGGWGLGLEIVAAVVSRHGGWIDVESAPGAGTQFLIGLPRCAPESDSEPTYPTASG